jgi:transposase InsO family protein
LRHARRRLVPISVTTNPTAEWIAGQVTDAFPWDEAPRHLIRDHDGAFGPAYTHRIRAMGIRDHPTAPRSPWQNGHVERLIGSISRPFSNECGKAFQSLTERLSVREALCRVPQ